MNCRLWFSRNIDWWKGSVCRQPTRIDDLCVFCGILNGFMPDVKNVDFMDFHEIFINYEMDTWVRLMM